MQTLPPHIRPKHSSQVSEQGGMNCHQTFSENLLTHFVLKLICLEENTVCLNYKQQSVNDI